MNRITEHVTDVLELIGMALLIVGIGWLVSGFVGIPIGLCAAALVAWLLSWVLQGAPLPQKRKPRGSE